MSKTVFVIFIVSIWVFLVSGQKPIIPSMNIYQTSQPHTRKLMEAKPEYTVKYYDQTVDHFTYSSKKTFKMRYLENINFWDKQNKGPNFLK